MALKDRLLRRFLAVAELPLAIIDTTLDHKVSVVGTAREILADKVRNLDKKMGHGPEAEPKSHFDPTPASPVVEEEPVPVTETTPDVEETKTPDVEEHKGPDIGEGKSPDSDESDSVDTVETKSPDAEETKTPDAVENKSPDVEETKSPDVEETKSPDVNTGPPPPPPFRDYDKLNVHKVSRRLRIVGEDILQVTETYERANKDRKTIYSAVQRRRDQIKRLEEQEN